MPRSPAYDTFLSAAFFLVFASLSAYAYASILKAEAPSHVFMREIAVGNKTFQIIHNGSCIGEISTALTKNENTVVKSSAEVNGAYGRMQTTVRATSTFLFNPLGQLVESASEILGRDVQIFVKTKEINPLKFQISATLGAKHYDFNLSAPGPVLLKKAGRDSYQIEYSQFRAGDGSFLKGIGSTLFSQAALNIIDASGSAVTCAPAQRSYLDVASLLLRANINSEAVQRFVPGLNE